MYVFNYHGDCKNSVKVTGVAVQMSFEELSHLCQAIRNAQIGQLEKEQKGALIGLRIALETKRHELEEAGQV